MNKNFPHPYDYYSVIKEIDPTSVVQIDMAKDDLSNLLWLDGNPNNITHEQIEQKRQELIDDWNTNIYRIERQMEYPNIQDVMVALAEKEEGDDTMWKEIKEKRKQVKAKFPKPE